MKFTFLILLRVFQTQSHMSEFQKCCVRIPKVLKSNEYLLTAKYLVMKRLLNWQCEVEAYLSLSYTKPMRG